MALNYKTIPNEIRENKSQAVVLSEENCCSYFLKMENHLHVVYMDIILPFLPVLYFSVLNIYSPTCK